MKLLYFKERNFTNIKVASVIINVLLLVLKNIPESIINKKE